MSTLEIELKDNRGHFRPGETLEGVVRWAFPETPRRLELRLLWFTRGRGTTDASVVESLDLWGTERGAQEAQGAETPFAGIVAAPMGDAPFRFRLPDAPHSFSGTLISLCWAVEIVVHPGKTATRREFVLSPSGQEIVLERVEKPKSALERRLGARKEALEQNRGLSAPSEAAASGFGAASESPFSSSSSDR